MAENVILSQANNILKRFSFFIFKIFIGNFIQISAFPCNYNSLFAPRSGFSLPHHSKAKRRRKQLRNKF